MCRTTQLLLSVQTLVAALDKELGAVRARAGLADDFARKARSSIDDAQNQVDQLAADVRDLAAELEREDVPEPEPTPPATPPARCQACGCEDVDLVEFCGRWLCPPCISEDVEHRRDVEGFYLNRVLELGLAA